MRLSPGPLWKSSPMPTRPVAIIELLIGLRLDPISSGLMNRQPNGLRTFAGEAVGARAAVSVVITVFSQGGGGALRSFRSQRSGGTRGRRCAHARQGPSRPWRLKFVNQIRPAVREGQ